MVPAPASLDPWRIAALGGVVMGSSLAVRGVGRSLTLLGVSLAVATAGEVLGIRVAGILRHHSRPQVGGLPVMLPVAWYAAVAPAYGLAQAALGGRGRGAVAAATAFLATSTDLANDPYGLASGFWEWADGGAYVADVRGANGVPGTPVGNYAGWLLIAGAVALISERSRRVGEVEGARRRRTPSLAAHLTVAAPGLLWALKERRWGLFSLSALAAVGGAGGAWLAAGR
jgi:putative membrane protein